MYDLGPHLRKERGSGEIFVVKVNIMQTGGQFLL
jgi:hypothetical protein